MLIAALEEMLALQVPLPPRRICSREATLLTSLRVAAAELQLAQALLTNQSAFHNTGDSHAHS
jgi:hypothetical protein